MTASPRIPVLLLSGPDPQLLDTVASRLAAALPGTLRLAALRNGMPPSVSRPGSSRLVVRDAGAACACCVGEVAARVALSRLLREGLAVGGWERLFLLAGPGAHASRLVALFGQGPPLRGAPGSGGGVGLRDAPQASPLAASCHPPRCIAILPDGMLERVGRMAPPARRLVVDALACAEAWWVDAPQGAGSNRPARTILDPPLEAFVAPRPRIPWTTLVDLARDPGTSLATFTCKDGPSP